MLATDGARHLSHCGNSRHFDRCFVVPQIKPAGRGNRGRRSCPLAGGRNVRKDRFRSAVLARGHGGRAGAERTASQPDDAAIARGAIDHHPLTPGGIDRRGGFANAGALSAAFYLMFAAVVVAASRTPLSMQPTCMYAPLGAWASSHSEGKSMRPARNPDRAGIWRCVLSRRALPQPASASITSPDKMCQMARDGTRQQRPRTAGRLARGLLQRALLDCDRTAPSA